MFIGYPKRTKGGLFYSREENKVSTNAMFLEWEFVNNYVPRSKAMLELLRSDIGQDNPQSNEVVPSRVANIQSKPSDLPKPIVVQEDPHGTEIEAEMVGLMIVNPQSESRRVDEAPR